MKQLRFDMEVKGIIFLFQVDILDFEIDNDGIGSYECHGYKGFDAGLDYVSDIKAVVYVYSEKLHRYREAPSNLAVYVKDQLFDNESLNDYLNKVCLEREE